MFVNGLWYFRGAYSTAILYHVHHNRTRFLHLYLRFWLAHRHPALPVRSGLAARSRTAPGCCLPDGVCSLPAVLFISCDGVLEHSWVGSTVTACEDHNALPAAQLCLSASTSRPAVSRTSNRQARRPHRGEVMLTYMQPSRIPAELQGGSSQSGVLPSAPLEDTFACTRDPGQRTRARSPGSTTELPAPHLRLRV